MDNHPIHGRSLSADFMYSAPPISAPTSPSHALQRIAPHVTAPASAAALPLTVQVPRRTPPSLTSGVRRFDT
jgi:hypothetical protein